MLILVITYIHNSFVTTLSHLHIPEYSSLKEALVIIPVYVKTNPLAELISCSQDTHIKIVSPQISIEHFVFSHLKYGFLSQESAVVPSFNHSFDRRQSRNRKDSFSRFIYTRHFLVLFCCSSSMKCVRGKVAANEKRAAPFLASDEE